MPTLPKQFVDSLYQAGAMIYGRLLPIPETELPKVENAFETFKTACENAVIGTVRVPAGEEPGTGTGPRPRGAPAMNEAIVGYLSTEPLAWCTPNQILRGIKTSRPNLKSEALQTRLKKDAGKPGMWIVGAAGRYGMPGAIAVKHTNGPANAGATPAAATKMMRQDVTLDYVIAHPGSAKDHVIANVKGQLFKGKPIRAQDVGNDLARLVKGGKITGGKTGPYWHVPAAQVSRQSAATAQPAA